MAPIDIVINIINRHKQSALDNAEPEETDYTHGQVDAYDGLIKELEGFKNLFN